MVIKITRSELKALDPCDLDRRIALFGRKRSLSASAALDAGASIEDILWVASKIGRKDLIVRFALASAQRVAYLNPDPRVQAALDATQAWLDTPTARDAGAAARDAGAAARDASGAAALAARAARNASGAAARDAAGAVWAAWTARDAARDAAGAAAAGAATRAAAGAAAWDDARDAEEQAQHQLIKEIFG